MAEQQAGESQPEVKSYDEIMTDDTARAYAEVMGKAEPETEVKTEPVKTEPEKTTPVEEKTQAERDRDEQGRFVAKTEKDEPKLDAKPVTTDKPVTEVKPVTQQQQVVDAKAPVAAPPPSWSIKSKSEWDKLSQNVRDDIAKRETEVSKGFSEYQGLKPFTERARQSGQTLTQALQAYTGIEDLIRRDIRGGMLHIAQNAGLTQHQAGQLFSMMAQQLGYAPSNGQMAPANQNGSGGSLADQNAGADPIALRQVFDPLLSPLMQRMQQLETNFTQQTEVQKSQRLTSANSVIEQFRQDPKHRYYDNLEQTIGDLLEGGVVKRTGDLAADLASAYEMACRINPEISETLLNERIAKTAEDKARAAKEAADKARQASRSVTGSPSPGSSNPAPKRDSKMSYDEDLQNDVVAAMRSVSARA